jgi:hypothetical protein
MRCAICGMEIDSIDEAIDEGWIPLISMMGKQSTSLCVQVAVRSFSNKGKTERWHVNSYNHWAMACGFSPILCQWLSPFLLLSP